MSQTIEEIILEKELELGLNHEQVKALKDYADQVSIGVLMGFSLTHATKTPFCLDIF